MFSTKQGTKLYDDGDMEAIIKRKSTALKKKGSRKGKLAFGEPLDQPRAAIQRMRSVVGAYLYLKEKKVNKIFVDQVNRIGAQLENLENQLAKTPKFVKRKYDDPDGGVVKIEKTVYFHPWKHQKLREKWFEYMDQVYETANQRGQDFMEENLARLEDEYNDSKLKEVQDAFKREKKKKEKDELSLEVQLRQEMKKNIEKLSSHWSKAKNWPRPQWNSQID